MTTDDDAAVDAYRAIGRYVVEFSRLDFHMRDAMERRLRRPGDPRALVRYAFNEVAAAGIAISFFAMCGAVGNLDEEEDRVRKWLAEQVIGKEIPERNRIAHGAWWLGVLDAETGKELPPGYTKTEAKRGKAFPWTNRPPDDLDKRTDALIELRNLVTEFGWICFDLPLTHWGHEGNLRVRDIFVLSGRGKRAKVTRAGPMARGTMHFA